MTAEDEAYILIHSLQDANLPKFLAEDVPLFESIMADLFPGIKPPEQDHGVLEVCDLFDVINSFVIGLDQTLTKGVDS